MSEHLKIYNGPDLFEEFPQSWGEGYKAACLQAIEICMAQKGLGHLDEINARGHLNAQGLGKTFKNVDTVKPTVLARADKIAGFEVPMEPSWQRQMPKGSFVQRQILFTRTGGPNEELPVLTEKDAWLEGWVHARKDAVRCCEDFLFSCGKFGGEDVEDLQNRFWQMEPDIQPSWRAAGWLQTIKTITIRDERAWEEYHDELGRLHGSPAEIRYINGNVMEKKYYKHGQRENAPQSENPNIFPN